MSTPVRPNSASGSAPKAPLVPLSPSESPVAAETSVRFVEEVGDLVALFEATTNVVCLRRTPDPELADEALDASQRLHPTKFILEPSTAAQTATSELWRHPHIAKDVAFLAELLTDLSGCSAVGVRLERASKAMCPRFHIDRVTTRFVVTYHGPATEFVASEHVDRRFLGHSELGVHDGVGGLLSRADVVQQAGCFDLVALKGELWPENEGHGAVHRSPSIDAGASRVVMTLDPL